jgi:hypothetical protein
MSNKISRRQVLKTGMAAMAATVVPKSIAAKKLTGSNEKAE